MAFDVSLLPNYTIQDPDILIHRSLFGGRTQSIMESEGNVMTGVKSSEQINRLATDALFQSGGVCGWSPSGNTSFSQRQVTVGKIRIMEALCPEDLEPKYTQQALKKGASYDTIAFMDDFSNLKADTVAEQLETAIWQGDTSLGNNRPNLNKFDGFIKIIDADGGAVNGNTGGITTGTGVTISNAFAIVNGMIVSMPATIQGKDDIRIFCGWDFFSKYITNLVNLNLFAYAPSGQEQSKETIGEITIPGTQYKLTAVHGLDGTNRLFGMRTSNMWLGVDLENDYEQFEMWYSKDNQEVRFAVKFKEGVQVGFPNEIVQFKLV